MLRKHCINEFVPKAEDFFADKESAARRKTCYVERHLMQYTEKRPGKGAEII